MDKVYYLRGRIIGHQEIRPVICKHGKQCSMVGAGMLIRPQTCPLVTCRRIRRVNEYCSVPSPSLQQERQQLRSITFHKDFHTFQNRHPRSKCSVNRSRGSQPDLASLSNCIAFVPRSALLSCARSQAVCPLTVFALLSAPSSINLVITSGVLPLAAKCNSVHP